jgi:hypothetical protein
MAEGGQEPRNGGPEFSAGTIHYEIAERNHAITCGGIGAMHQLANNVGLVEALNRRLQILQRRLVLDDIELRRNDVAFLDALGARTIPDPTTAGDYCRRFQPGDIGC